VITGPIGGRVIINELRGGMARNSRVFFGCNRPFASTLFVFLSFAGVTAMSLSSDALAQKLSQPEKVIFGIPAMDAGFLPLFVAKDRKFFRDEGIEAEIVHVKADIATKGLITGDVDYSAAAGSVARAATAGMPLKVILYLTRRPAFFLISQPNITNVKDLKGQALGVQDFAGGTNYYARSILQAHSLNPDRDVTYLVTGAAAPTLTALKTGRIQGAMLYPPFNIMAVESGFKEIAYAGDYVQFPMNGYGTSDKKISQNPAQIKAVIRALLKGVNYVMDNQSYAVGLLMKDWNLGKELASGVFESITKGFTRNGEVAEEGIKAEINMARERLKISDEIPNSKVISFGLLREARKELGSNR
jgi:NitT/TauT family transport system substrate-binding protein